MDADDERGENLSRVAERLRRGAGAVLLAAGLLTALASPASADAAGQGGDYVPLPNGEARVLNTQTGVGVAAGVRGPDSTTTFQVLGVGGVPAAGVRAVMVDVTT